MRSPNQPEPRLPEPSTYPVGCQRTMSHPNPERTTRIPLRTTSTRQHPALGTLSRHRRVFTSLSLTLTIAACCPVWSPAQSPSELEFQVQCDPTKVVSSERCSQCHASAVQVWAATPHAQSFERLHLLPEAKAIAQRMGYSSVKRGASCIECHYTPQLQGDKIKPIAGVSCESCHGAALDWVTLHNDYGEAGSKAAETQTQAAERVARSVEAGMRNPRNLYRVAESCLSCHTVPREDLVNHGGHQPGSLDFELVAWSQGSLRHNFLRTQNTTNAENSIERLRVMYVVGLMADLEKSTRATGRATEVGTYGVTAAQRAADRAMRLLAIQEEIRQPRLEEALLAFAEAELTTENSAQLEAIADRIRAAGLAFAEEVDGATLAALDARLPAPHLYR